MRALFFQIIELDWVMAEAIIMAMTPLMQDAFSLAPNANPIVFEVMENGDCHHNY